MPRQEGNLRKPHPRDLGSIVATLLAALSAIGSGEAEIQAMTQLLAFADENDRLAAGTDAPGNLGERKPCRPARPADNDKTAYEVHFENPKAAGDTFIALYVCARRLIAAQGWADPERLGQWPSIQADERAAANELADSVRMHDGTAAAANGQVH